MIGMLTRHNIQVLTEAGHSPTDVAALAGVSEHTVRRVRQESPVTHTDDGAARATRRIGRPSTLEPFRKTLQDLLAEKPPLMGLEILRRVRLAGYTGGKTALYDLVRSLRPEKVRPLVRFEGLPGEFTQHDFGHVDVRFIHGPISRVHFFTSRLKYSRWVQVSLVPDERVETLVRSMVDHFAAMGGVPLLAVFDRPKTIAISWAKDGTVTEWNSTFAGVMLDLGLGVDLCWPHSPQQKGSVENLVGWVKGSFFKQRRFLDDEDLHSQLATWLVEVNTLRPSRATGVIPEVRMNDEHARLRPLKAPPDQLALRIPVFVGPTGMVLHDTHLYSMAPAAIGIAGTLSLYRDRVRITAGRFTSEHERLFLPGARSVLPEHRAETVAAVSGARGRRYLKRKQLLDLGPPALHYLTELVHRRPNRWFDDVDRLHDLLIIHGNEAVAAAFQNGLDDHLFGAEYIAHSLAFSSQLEIPL